MNEASLFSLTAPLALFALGACVGSFLNVVIIRNVARLKAGDKVSLAALTGRSHCPHCRRQLTWWELLPLLSFIALRGQCVQCRYPISLQYPLVEAGFGLAALMLGSRLLESYRRGESLLLPDALGQVFTLLAIAMLVVLFVIDLRTMLLPDVFITTLAVVAMIGVLISCQLSQPSPGYGGQAVVSSLLPAVSCQSSVVSSLLGAALGAGFLLMLWLVTRGHGMGLGDVKLMVPLGLILGPWGTIVLLWIAFLTGGVVGGWLLVTRRARLATAIPFGPFLTGTSIVLLLVPAIVPSAVRLLWPFG